MFKKKSVGSFFLALWMFDQGKRQKCLASNKHNCFLSDRGLLSARFTEETMHPK